MVLVGEMAEGGRGVEALFEGWAVDLRWWQSSRWIFMRVVAGCGFSAGATSEPDRLAMTIVRTSIYRGQTGIMTVGSIWGSVGLPNRGWGSSPAFERLQGWIFTLSTAESTQKKYSRLFLSKGPNFGCAE